MSHRCCGIMVEHLDKPADGCGRFLSMAGTASSSTIDSMMMLRSVELSPGNVVLPQRTDCCTQPASSPSFRTAPCPPPRASTAPSGGPPFLRARRVVVLCNRQVAQRAAGRGFLLAPCHSLHPGLSVKSCCSDREQIVLAIEVDCSRKFLETTPVKYMNRSVFKIEMLLLLIPGEHRVRVRTAIHPDRGSREQQRGEPHRGRRLDRDLGQPERHRQLRLVRSAVHAGSSDASIFL